MEKDINQLFHFWNKTRNESADVLYFIPLPPPVKMIAFQQSKRKNSEFSLLFSFNKLFCDSFFLHFRLLFAIFICLHLKWKKIFLRAPTQQKKNATWNQIKMPMEKFLRLRSFHYLCIYIFFIALACMFTRAKIFAWLNGLFRGKKRRKKSLTAFSAYSLELLRTVINNQSRARSQE